MTQSSSAASSEFDEVVADWVATSGLVPSREASLVVARVDNGGAGRLDVDAARLPRDGVLLVVARVRDHRGGLEVLRTLRGWQASRHGLRLARFDDLAAEDGGSWWRLAYRPSGR